MDAPYYPLIEQAIHYIDRHQNEQPSLDTLAHALGLSPYHLQRIFKQWVGISPKKFLQYLTVQHTRELLQSSRSVLDAAYAGGLSGGGRIHDLFVNIYAVTPGEYRRGYQGIDIYYAGFDSPFGHCMLAATSRGLCFTGFYGDGNQKTFMTDMTARFPQAQFIKEPSRLMGYYEHIFPLRAKINEGKISLFLKATPFQLQVWEALLRIPEGMVCSYQDIARLIGKPKASRAVGQAVGKNPISYLIPCHRVIKNIGITGNYHWGKTRKKVMLVWESAQNENS